MFNGHSCYVRERLVVVLLSIGPRSRVAGFVINRLELAIGCEEILFYGKCV